MALYLCCSLNSRCPCLLFSQVSSACPLIPYMDAPSLVRFLWACSKYKLNVAKLSVSECAAPSQQQQALLDTDTADASVSAGTDVPSNQQLVQQQGEQQHSSSPSASLLDSCLTHLHKHLHFHDLTPSLAAQLLSSLSACGAQPDADLMDDCLVSLLAPHVSCTLLIAFADICPQQSEHACVSM